jgi:LPXTG-motif cell wall-anchored protein
MSEHESDREMESEARQFSRRQAIKGVVGVGAVAWTVPTLQMVSMTAAHADSPSVPGTPSVPPSTETPPQTTPPAVQTTPPATTTTPPATTTTAPEVSVATPSTTPSQVLGEKVGPTPSATSTSNEPDALPHTGASDSTFKVGIAGAAAIGLGAAIIAATRSTEDSES